MRMQAVEGLYAPAFFICTKQSLRTRARVKELKSIQTGPWPGEECSSHKRSVKADFPIKGKKERTFPGCNNMQYHFGIGESRWK